MKPKRIMIRVDWENKALTIDWEGDNRSNNERLIAPERDMVIGSGSSRPSIYAVATSCHFFFSFYIFQFDSPQRKINLNQPEIEKTKTNKQQQQQQPKWWNNNNNSNNKTIGVFTRAASSSNSMQPTPSRRSWSIHPRHRAQTPFRMNRDLMCT